MLRLSTSAPKFWLLPRLSVPGIRGFQQRARASPTHPRQLTHTMSSRSIFNSAEPKTWYRTSIPLDEPWSCDWENWDDAGFFLHPYGAQVIRETWGIAGEIQPLAFLPGWYMPEPTFVFVADGVYYWATYGGLKRIDGPFASHDDFLRRLGEDEEMWARGTEVTNILETETDYGQENLGTTPLRATVSS
ncbi:hypothetical protein FB451DRAFT_1273351 [Mycena latifolia]|nr:hypothetical protein FB451DRAFT_1273351 [Mycena latifolia]